MITHTFKQPLVPICAFALLLCAACNSPRKLEGTYVSKFAELGMFGTSVKLKEGNQFEYRFRGDLMFDTASGSYTVKDEKLYLEFKRKENDNPLSLDLSAEPTRYDTVHGVPIKYHRFYYIGKDKLFPTHIETGKKVTKAHGFSKRRKYFLFGPHYFNRRFYLKKVS